MYFIPFFFISSQNFFFVSPLHNKILDPQMLYNFVATNEI